MNNMKVGGAPKELLCVVGARPNFVKIAPILRAMEEREELNATRQHSGQQFRRFLMSAGFGDAS